MSYVSAAQVTSESRYTFSATSKVTTDKLTEIIAETDAEINKALYETYVTPITGTEALIAVRKIALDICVGRVEKILRRGQDALQDQNEEGKAEVVGRYAAGYGALTRLRAGSDVLSDAVRRQATSGVVAYNEDVTPMVDFGNDGQEDRY
jgi:hypothetical protein